MDWIFSMGISLLLLLSALNFGLSQYNSVCSRWSGVCKGTCNLWEIPLSSLIQSDCGTSLCCVPLRGRQPTDNGNDTDERSLPGSGCGNSTLLTSRISGGWVGAPTDWPWLVRIHAVSPTSGQGICGGALVDDATVLTVAHCVDRFSADQLRVVVGDFDLTVTDVGEEVIQVTNVNISPGFVRGQRGSDLAVLRLSRPVQLSVNKWPVCLSSQSTGRRDVNLVNTGVEMSGLRADRCFLAGWGATPDGRVRSGRVRLLDRRRCEGGVQLPIGVRQVPLPDDLICSDTSFASTDSCRFDDGALLSCQDSSSRFVLVGLVTESSCGRLPTLYTRVESFLEPIRARLQQPNN